MLRSAEAIEKAKEIIDMIDGDDELSSFIDIRNMLRDSIKRHEETNPTGVLFTSREEYLAQLDQTLVLKF